MELGTPSDPIAAALDLLAAHAERLAVLDTQVAVLGERVSLLDQVDADPAGELPYEPAPARRWWRLVGKDREHTLEAVRAWVEQVYRPGYGQLAATLGPCWEQHPLCLYALDILTELWSVLYLSESRSAGLLSMQAEFQARVLPALAEQMAAETGRCRHRGDQHLGRPAAHVRPHPVPHQQPEADPR